MNNLKIAAMEAQAEKLKLDIREAKKKQRDEERAAAKQKQYALVSPSARTLLKKVRESVAARTRADALDVSVAENRAEQVEKAKAQTEAWDAIHDHMAAKEMMIRRLQDRVSSLTAELAKVRDGK